MLAEVLIYDTLPPSEEYPTTMMPVLTTPREARSFDFVPVNIIRDDGKETSFRDRNFGDFSDVSLVPAGTNSRIQVSDPACLLSWHARANDRSYGMGACIE